VRMSLSASMISGLPCMRRPYKGARRKASDRPPTCQAAVTMPLRSPFGSLSRASIHTRHVPQREAAPHAERTPETVHAPLSMACLIARSVAPVHEHRIAIPTQPSASTDLTRWDGTHSLGRNPGWGFLFRNPNRIGTRRVKPWHIVRR
jgi:hypothetical protein